MQGLKSAILAIFQNWLGWLCPVSAAPKNPSQESKNSFCFGCRFIPRKTGRQNQKGPIFDSICTLFRSLCFVYNNCYVALKKRLELYYSKSLLVSNWHKYLSDFCFQPNCNTYIWIWVNKFIKFVLISG